MSPSASVYIARWRAWVNGDGRVTDYACVGRAGGVLGGGRLPLSLRSAGRHRPTALARSALT